FVFYLPRSAHHNDLHTFPTRRSSDLLFLIGIFTIYLVLSGNRALTLKAKSKADNIDKSISGAMLLTSIVMTLIGIIGMAQKIDKDRKSTRLNSSHVKISYAVFGSTKK